MGTLPMYEEFYGFHDTPFRLTPDPHYLFLSAKHQEALGHLIYGVNEGSGVIIITGEIGTGKTTLVRTLMRDLDTEAAVAYIFNPALSALELLQAINTELGLTAAGASKRELVDHLNRFLLEQKTMGRRVVVVVDEAQDLDPAVLEQLRLLSNLETEREKLLLIILVGQPELREMLARPELAQLNQRVTLRWHLEALNEQETAAYIRHRLRVAADGREPVTFARDALHAVYRFTHGVPRLTNTVCHRTLLVGYTSEERTISRSTVRQAIQELTLHVGRSPRLLPWQVSLGVAVLAVVLLFVVAVSGTEPVRHLFSLTPSTSLATPTAEGKTVMELSASLPISQPILSPAATSTGTLSVALGRPPTVSQAEPSRSGHKRELSTASYNELVPQTSVLTYTEEAFLGSLQRLDLARSATQAVDGLLRTWGTEGIREEERQGEVLDLSRIARTRRLEYLPISGNLNLLTLLDLPVIVELLTPEEKELRFILLLKTNGSRCWVLLDKEQEIPFGVISNNWFGKAHLFWRNFEGLGAYLTIGSVGQNVKRLHTLLQRAQVYPEPPSTTFDTKTEQAVAFFQRAKRLVPDGVVGPFTMIMLYNSLSSYPHPRLTAETENPSLQEKET